MDKVQKIKTMVATLNKYRDSYYNQNESLVSDLIYDSLFDELKVLETETGFILSNSPTQSVGYKILDGLSEVQHKTPLRSLDKTKSVEDIVEFSKRKELVAMLKLDGLTVELEYSGGRLIRGSTRGDGNVGEDITHNIPMFKNIPLTIPTKEYVRLSGEAIIHKHDFNRINEQLTEEEKKRLPKGKYSTCRNLVSGSVRQLDSQVCANREVHFFACNVLEFTAGLVSKRIELHWLNDQGFDVVDSFYVNYDVDVISVQHGIDVLENLAKIKNIPIDGIVFTFNDFKYGESLGTTSHHPLHSKAFKFEDETADTILREVEWSIGRTGRLTPVAIFDTVELDGTEVSRASLHNLSIIEKLQLGVGDVISIHKANMIIPQVVMNKTKSNNLDIPKTCPVCGGQTIIIQEDDSKVLYCENIHCKGRLLAKLVHFVSKPAMNIKGLSDATLKRFIDKEWLKTFADLYKLDAHKDDIIDMDGFSQKSYLKLWDAIQKSRDVKLENFLVAMGIPNVGKTASKVISVYCNGDWDTFGDMIIKHFDFTQLEDFGKVMHESLREWYYDFINDDVGVIHSMNFIKPQSHVAVSENSPFTNKKVYPTGTFANYKKDELKNLLEELGAAISSGYAKSLDYLIVGSVKGSSKEDKAKKDGVVIISEQEFEDMVEGLT